MTQLKTPNFVFQRESLKEMEVLGKDEWTVAATGERVERTRAENPQNMTTGCRQFNWEELHFREWVLRWEDVCTDTAIVYYCDDPKEFSHSLTLRNKKEGTSVYVENSITNYREPEKSMAEHADHAIQPFLDALLGACGIAPTLKNWLDFCLKYHLADFVPSSCF